MRIAILRLTASLLSYLSTHALAATLYVDLNSLAPVSPYTNWFSAATNIQDAVDAASPGDEVLVTNGTYHAAGRLTSDGTTNVVAVTNALRLRSVNGPTATLINGGNAKRCVYLADGAVLEGFTLTNGNAGQGGGVWCASTNEAVLTSLLISNTASSGGGAYSGTLSNCTLSGNACPFTGGTGGGASGATLNNCTLSGNATGRNYPNDTGTTLGGGAASCTLNNCTLSANKAYGAGACGGGAWNSVLNNCTLSQNFGDYGGGGADSCTLNNCMLFDNTADYGGGGVIECNLNNCVLSGNDGGFGGGAYFNCTLNNCTLSGNWAGYGGGAYDCTLHNCINYHNSGGDNYGNTFDYCCTPDGGGEGNITNAPLFGGDFRLYTYSPCVNAGNNAYVTTTSDLYGSPRIVGGTVDIGACEDPSATPASGLPSVPTNVTAVLQAGKGVLSWSPSIKATSYNIRRSLTSAGPYTTLASGVQATNYTDSAITNGGAYYYVVTAVNACGESTVSQQVSVYFAAHFTFASIASPQTSSVPFAVTLSACDSNGVILTNFTGAAILSAAGDRGELPLTPATTAAFLNGQWRGMITLGAEFPDTNIRLRASSNSLAGVSAPFDASPPAIQTFNLGVADLVYNRFARKLYATVPSSAGALSNRLVVIDPVIGRIEKSLYLGDDPGKLALSDDGHFLYIGFRATNVFRRFDLSTSSIDLQVPLGQNDYYGWPYYAADLAVLPGLPHSVAISRAAIWMGYDPTILLFDDGTQRSNGLALPYNNSWALEAASSTLLYSGGYFYRIAIDDAGVAAADGHDGLVGFFEDIKYQAGRIYTSGGTVIEGETATVLGHLPACSLTEPDLAKGRVFTLASQPVWPQGHSWTLYAFDALCLQQVSAMPIPGYIKNPGGFIRWGTNGLAFASTDVYDNPSLVWLIRTSLVPTGPPADLAITMSDTPHPATLGNGLTYQIQVTNNGPSEAQATLFQDVLPSGVTLVSATSTLGTCNWSNGVVTCDFGMLSNGSAVTITLTVTPNVIGLLTNLALVSTLSFDPGVSNNSAVTITPSQHVPFAETQQTWRQSATYVTLQGMALPNGLPSIAWFEWGLRGSYDQTTAPVSIGAGGAVTRVSSPIAGLVEGTVYQCRLVASNEMGVAYGQMNLFTTGRKILGWGDNSSGQTSVPTGLSNVVALATGRYHGLSLRGDGKVVAWGGNNYGQTNVPAGLANVVAVAAGDAQSVALRADGTVAAWGQSYAGATNVPAGLSGVVAVAAGQGGNLALKANGTLVDWGEWVGIPAGLSNVVAIAAGNSHKLAVRADGTVVSWGYNAAGQTNVPAGLTNVVAVAGGLNHSLALRADGTVVAWGENGYGQCDVPADLTNAVAVAAGFRHSLALKRDGTIVAWGLNNSGQTVVPAGVRNVALMAGGVTHSLADGDNLPPQAAPQVIPWPANQELTITLSGNDLNGDALSYRITVLPEFGLLYQFTNGIRGVAIVSADTLVTDPGHRLIFVPEVNGSGKPYATFRLVLNDGEVDSNPATVSLNIGNVYAHTQPPSQIRPDTATLNGMVLANGLASVAWFEWGERGSLTNATAVLDAGAAATVLRFSQTIPGLRPRVVYQCRLVVSNIAGTFYASPKVFSTGTKMSAWGYNVYGQGSVPAGLSNVLAVSAGAYFSVALRADGNVTAWGNNWYGQTTVPTSLSNVVAISAGAEFALALKADGTVAAWGRNDYAQSRVPTGLSNVVAIAAGGRHGLALKAEGTVVGWGWNTYNQTNVPTGVSNVVAVAAGEGHSVVLKADGVVVPWGYSAYGLTTVPAGASNVVDIAAKFYDNLALNSDGTVAAWGSNSAGQTNVPDIVTGACAVAAGNSHNLAFKTVGTLVAWGGNSNGQTNVPQGLGDVTSIAAGAAHSLAVGGNLAPQATSNSLSGLANHDLVISLAGNDPNGDPLRFRVSALPLAGTLYQYANGVRGTAIHDTVTPVTDPNGRVIFAPAMNECGSPYTEFRFVADDGETDSSPALVTITIPPTTNPTITSFGFDTNGTYTLAFVGDSNTTYCVWASTNLLGWEYLGSAAHSAPGKFSFSDPSASTIPLRFYRISTGCLAPAAHYYGCSRSAEGTFEMRFTGSPKSAYRVWASTNLTDWQALGIATETEAGLYRFVDLSAADWSQRFYRAGTP